MALTPKQERFCREYVIDLNAAAAARRAGYSERTAKSIGQENLTKPDLQARIAELQAVKNKELDLTAEIVLQQLYNLGFADPINYFDDQNCIRKVSDMDKASRMALESFEVREEFDAEHRLVGYVKKVKISSKLGPLTKLGEHLAIFDEGLKQAFKEQMEKLKKAEEMYAELCRANAAANHGSVPAGGEPPR